MAETLASYRTELRRLLHDANGAYWTDAALNAYLNRAVKQRDRDTGENRLVQTITLTTGTREYVYNAPPFDTRTFDVLSIVLIWGNWRTVLPQVSYTDLSTVFQPYDGYRQVPAAWAKLGATRVRIGPEPNQNYTSEWDTLVVAADLVNDSDPDPLPYPWTDPVPFLAAHFAKLEIQQHAEAQMFRELYNTRLREVLAGARGRQLENPYARLGGL